MKSNRDSETDVGIKIQKTLISINDISLKIKKELEMIKELVQENGHLHTVVNTANQTLSKKVQEMGLNVAEIISESERNDSYSDHCLRSVIEMIDTMSRTHDEDVAEWILKPDFDSVNKDKIVRNPTDQDKKCPADEDKIIRTIVLWHNYNDTKNHYH